jgi:sulfur carrier protein
MNLVVNGQVVEAEAGATVAVLCEKLGFKGKAVAVEVNKQLVPKKRHAETALHPDDRVEIVTLVGGG